MNDNISLNENELIYMVRQKDEKAFEMMKQKYELLIYRLAHDLIKKYPYVYSVQDDLVQEGLIGLNTAIHCYRSDTNSKFITFAYLVIQRQMKNYLRGTSRTYLNEHSYEDLTVQERSASYAGQDYAQSPSDIFFSNFESDQLKKAYYSMKDEDRRLLKYKLMGKSYAEISELCNITKKQVDNRLQKIKHYMIDYLNIM